MVLCINRFSISLRGFMGAFLIILFCSLLMQPSCLWAGQLLSIRPVVVDGVYGVEIQADTPLTYTYYRIPGQMMAALDVADLNVTAAEPLVVMQKGGFLSVSLDSVYIARMPVGRITFELDRESDISVVPSPDKKRLVVRLTSPSPMPKPAVSNVPKDTVLAEPQKAVAPKREDQIVRPTRSADTLTTTVPVADSFTHQHRNTLSIDGIVVGNTGVEIKATGNIAEFKQMVLEQPVRLVIDIPGATATLRTKTVSVRKHGINRIRVGIYPTYTRIVLDADTTATFSGYTIEPTATGLKVNLVAPSR